MKKEKVIKEEANQETKPQEKERDWGSFCTSMINNSIQNHRQRQLEMYNAHNFYSSNHYQSYNVGSGKLIKQPNGITDNRIKPIVRTVANSLTKIRPKWNVNPDDDSDSSFNQAAKTNVLLEHLFKSLKMKSKSRMVVKHALVLKSGWFYIGYDPEKNNGRGAPVITVENPFYIFWDPSAQEYSDCRYVFRILKRQLADVRNDKYYDETARKMVKPQMKLGATPIYQSVMAASNQQQEESGDEVDQDEAYGNAYIAEIYIKEMVDVAVKVEDDEENEAGDSEQEEKAEKKTVKTKTKKMKRIRRICCDASNPKTILSNKITDLEDFPLEPYYATRSMLTPDGESVVTDLISLNQALNRFRTLQILAGERAGSAFVLPNGSKVDIKTLSDGNKVYYIDGKLTKSMPQINVGGLPQAAEIIGSSINAMEEIGGVHNLSSFAGSKSGVAIENLIDLDSESSIDYKENLEDFFVRVANKLLWNISKYGAIENQISYKEKDKTSVMRYVGSKSRAAEDIKDTNLKVEETKNADSDDVLLVSPNNNIEVTIDTELAHTMEAKLTRLQQLLEMEVIDAQGVRDELKFGNDIDMVKRMQEREEKRMKLEAEAKAQAAMQMQAPGGQMPPMPGQPPMEQPPVDPNADMAETMALQEQLSQLASAGKLPPQLMEMYAQLGQPA